MPNYTLVYVDYIFKRKTCFAGQMFKVMKPEAPIFFFWAIYYWLQLFEKWSEV